MKVVINHKEIEVDEGVLTLGQLLEKENLNGQGQAVAVNNRLVTRGAWNATSLEEGMKITVIRAVCGG